MKAIGRCVVLAILLFVSVTSRAEPTQLSELNYYTEEYPPSNFIQRGELVGYAVDILQEASRRVGEPVEVTKIKLGPWARGYRSTLTDDQGVLFATTRTDHREKLFNWVGPISDIKVVVLARKEDNIVINDPLDMANYIIGVIRDDIGEQSLLELGIPRNAMQEASYVTTLAEQLKKKRIDLLAYDENAAYWWASQVAVEGDTFEPVYVLTEGHVYFAFNLNVPQSLLDKLQHGIDLIKSERLDSGETVYQSIMNKYR
ncbi:substrate-binding periplasmic protein [Vibrio sonorensis]|uniref:substrate-binding periplasmic protein n=1 Tax=Vibrio sonorensis TaxID=1004316 RepID=UPI0008DAF467|nr:ABC transporter substrate-binding protein [Vibrio sonorensis]